MQKKHGFISLILLVGGMLAACAPAPATDVPITNEPTEPPTTEATETVAPTETTVNEATPAEVTEEATLEPTPTLRTISGFTPISNDPILETESQYMDPGAVVYHAGMYHLFANDFNGWPARVDIIYARSSDGVNWEQPSVTPILNESDVEYAELAILATSALVQDNGTWVLYFYTWDSRANPPTGRIGRATAPAPEGPWTADPQPALEPGSDGKWDAGRVGSASILATDDGYVMYYAANTIDGPAGGVGMATSADGITWTKYNDPATGDAYAESDPVFGAGEAGMWDAMHVFQPNVVRTENGYVMLYSGIPTLAPPQRGFAFSEDGITWIRSSQNPVFPPHIIRAGANIWFTNLLYIDGTFHVFLEVGKGSKTRVYLATNTGEIEK